MNDMEFAALKTQARVIAGKVNYVKRDLSKLQLLRIEVKTLLDWLDELIDKELKKK